jgi:hypothetical protein
MRYRCLLLWVGGRSLAFLPPIVRAQYGLGPYLPPVLSRHPSSVSSPPGCVNGRSSQLRARGTQRQDLLPRHRVATTWLPQPSWSLTLLSSWMPCPPFLNASPSRVPALSLASPAWRCNVPVVKTLLDLFLLVHGLVMYPSLERAASHPPGTVVFARLTFCFHAVSRCLLVSHGLEVTIIAT